MSNPLYDSYMNNPSNPQQMIHDLMTNPAQFIMKQGFNIPNNIPLNPDSIIQYLLNTGQISQNYYNNTVQLANSFRNQRY